MTRRAGRRVAAALLAAGVVVGCGVGTDETFKELEPADVPFDLDATTTAAPTTTSTTVRPTTTTTAPTPTTAPMPLPSTTTTVAPSTTTTTAAPLYPRTLFFVRDGKLVAVTRFVPAPPTAAEVIADLTAGSQPTDQPTGLRAVVRPEHVASVVTTGGIARVGLTADFGERLPAGEQQLAIAQLVYTLTALPGIGQVAFERDTQPIDVPRSDGSLASGLITREDFPDVLGR